jgi:hypothetical protein
MPADDTVRRRRFLRSGLAASTLAATGCLQFEGEPSTATADPESTPTPAATPASGSVVFSQGFESVSVGGFPDGWNRAFGDEQRVVDSLAAAGDRSLELRGHHGGCNESLAGTEIPLSDATRIDFSVYPSSDGTVGCHEGRQAKIMLANEPPEDAYPDQRVDLLTFTPDGQRAAHDQYLGPYTEDQWMDVTVVYRRDGERVTQEYFFDGSRVDTVERDATDAESELAAIHLESGDFTNYWDAFEVRELS